MRLRQGSRSLPSGLPAALTRWRKSFSTKVLVSRDCRGPSRPIPEGQALFLVKKCHCAVACVMGSSFPSWRALFRHRRISFVIGGTRLSSRGTKRSSDCVCTALDCHVLPRRKRLVAKGRSSQWRPATRQSSQSRSVTRQSFGPPTRCLQLSACKLSRHLASCSMSESRCALGASAWPCISSSACQSRTRLHDSTGLPSGV